MREPAIERILRKEDNDRAIVEVVQRVLDGCGKTPREIEQALFDTLYEEKRRVEKDHNRRRARIQSKFYNRIQSEALRANSARQRELLKEVIQFFAHEVAGHFNPNVYSLTTKVIPRGLSVMLNALSPLKLVKAVTSGFSSLEERLFLSGEIPAMQSVARKGTVILLPTHSSNLDSPLVGFALFKLGLSPFVYGAGLNLFENKLMGYFMDNLGAYKVDRRKTNSVYKNVLKTYAGCTMEMGFNNLFFPGGTRSRSGAVESKLKLGLIGMGLTSYINNLINKKENPDIFVVPCTINYHLVLEAETLIDDHLKAVGQSRYIIQDDEFSKPFRILDFVQKLFSLDSRIHLVFGRPMDVFGNLVDDDGKSHDKRGRHIDRTQYVMNGNEPVLDQQRDMEYTRELAHSVAGAYQKDTVVNSTNVVSRVFINWLFKNKTKSMDLYRILRSGGPDESMLLSDTCEDIDRLMVRLRELSQADKLKLDKTLVQGDAAQVLNEALVHLKSYHTRPALERRGDRVFHLDRKLLLYYQNRLNGYDLQDGRVAS